MCGRGPGWEGGAKVEAQEPWCKQERFLNHKDSQKIFETKINVALRRSTECWRTEAGANTVPNSNLKIWNWYKLLTLWKVVLIDLYALLSNSLYCEHESATFLVARIFFLEKGIFVSIADFSIFFVPKFCVNANYYVEGSEAES